MKICSYPLLSVAMPILIHVCVILFSDTQLGEHQKSASFVSTHTNHSEDNIQLLQSSGSIEGHVDGEEEGEGHTQGTWFNLFSFYKEVGRQGANSANAKSMFFV